MESVIINDFGVMLGKPSERLVVRGLRPRLEMVEGGPQLFLPLELVPRPPLRVLTSSGIRTPAPPITRDLPKTRSAKIMRRLIRATYLGKPAGDVSSLENPDAVKAVGEAT